MTYMHLDLQMCPLCLEPWAFASKLAGLDLLAQAMLEQMCLNLDLFLHPQRAYLDQLRYTLKTGPPSSAA